jgi:hypothetical protein
MTWRRRSALPACIFFAFTAPFGIAAHLTSELAGLGWHDDADVLFSVRHGYLAIIAFTALAAFALVLRSMPADSRSRRVSDLVETLPFGGRGAGFFALSFVVQFGFFAVTQIGEGCPLCGGDVFVGILAAAAAALIGALIVTFAKRRVLELAMGLVWYRPRALRAERVHVHSRREQHAADASSPRRSPFSFRYRPPPIVA